MTSALAFAAFVAVAEHGNTDEHDLERIGERTGHTVEHVETAPDTRDRHHLAERIFRSLLLIDQVPDADHPGRPSPSVPLDDFARVVDPDPLARLRAHPEIPAVSRGLTGKIPPALGSHRFQIIGVNDAVPQGPRAVELSGLVPQQVV